MPPPNRSVPGADAEKSPPLVPPPSRLRIPDDDETDPLLSNGVWNWLVPVPDDFVTAPSLLNKVPVSLPNLSKVRLPVISRVPVELLLNTELAFTVIVPALHTPVALLFSIFVSRVLVVPLEMTKSASTSGSASTINEPPPPTVPPVHSNRSVTEKSPVPPSTPLETWRIAVVEPLMLAVPPLISVVPVTLYVASG